jgi:hypothetical protein
VGRKSKDDKKKTNGRRGHMIWYGVISFIILTVFVVICFRINEDNFNRYAAMGTFLSAGFALIALIFFIFQTTKIIDAFDLQLKTFNVENRPYLHAVLNPSDSNPNTLAIAQNKDDKTMLHAGGYLSLKNKGKVPATIIKAEYKVVSDEAPEQDIVKYFEKRGGFPHINVVFPDEVVSRVFLNPQVGRRPQLVQVWAKVVYTGTDPSKKYWYSFNYLYGLKYIDDKGSIQIVQQPINALENWDRNIDTNQPQYEMPDWKYYKSTLEERK